MYLVKSGVALQAVFLLTFVHSLAHPREWNQEKVRNNDHSALANALLAPILRLHSGRGPAAMLFAGLPAWSAERKERVLPLRD